MNGTLMLENIPIDRPSTLKEALFILSRASKRPAILAGGTDLMVSIGRGLYKPESVIDISLVEELRKIEARPDRISIGALATYSEIIAHPKTPSALSAAARTIGATQIQNRGTMGGNIANGSPAGDTLPVLLALNAEIEVGSTHGSRTIPFKDYYTGYRSTSMTPDEMILRIHIPIP